MSLLKKNTNSKCIFFFGVVLILISFLELMNLNKMNYNLILT